MRKLLGTLSIVILLALPAVALAHGKHPHVRGTIASVDATHMEVKTTDGQTKSVALRPDTKYFNGKAAGAASDASVGSKVVIDMGHDGKADEVHVTAAKSSPKM